MRSVKSSIRDPKFAIVQFSAMTAFSDSAQTPEGFRLHQVDSQGQSLDKASSDRPALFLERFVPQWLGNHEAPIACCAV
jgi:hypothetical protein